MDRFPRDFCPPDRGGLEWLHHLTPRGAPWVFNTRVPAVGGDRASTYRLPRVGFDADGPVFTTAAIPEPRPPRRPGRRRREPWRAIAVAARIDVDGLSTIEVATMLYLAPDLGRAHSRSAVRWRDDGRRLLHQLGVWPWSLAERLDPGWRQVPRYAEALAHWHREVTVFAFADAAACMARPGPDRYVWRPAPPDHLIREGRDRYDAERRRRTLGHTDGHTDGQATRSGRTRPSEIPK